MIRVIYFLDFLLTTYFYLIIAAAIVSWLIAFQVINMRNDFVRTIVIMLNAVTEPALRPIRRIVPTLAGLDISPVILLIIILFIQQVVLGNLLDALQVP